MIKLGDFGLADKLAGADRSSDGERGRLWCGTPCYLSPEEVRHEAYGTPSDVWALGVVAYELLTLRRPFRAGRCAPPPPRMPLVPAATPPLPPPPL